MRTFKFLGLSWVAVFLATSIQAGNLAPDLADRLSSAKSDQMFSVIIKMADQVDMQSLKASLKARSARLPERHKVVIESLKLKAGNSQKGIVGYLNAARNSGRVEDFKTFWIANLVWAKATASEIQILALRPDVETIYLTPKVELVTPVTFQKIDYQAQVAGKIEQGIKDIKTPQVWALGYTGKGRLVCNIDTGVDRGHTTLGARWRGLFVPSDKRGQTWYDPVYNSPYPRDDTGSSKGHGTFTMGIMTGINNVSGDTIGVAPQALWIAARAIDIGASWPVEIAALQWSAEPDGDPNTLDDVPDVVNNSWGIPKTAIPTCWELYWQVLDNVATAGPVVVFAAGNEGPNANTIRNPADRIASDFNTFSVGSINGNDTINFPISSFSSRGPSDCDGVTKKPEVVAPGEDIRSAYPGNFFAVGSGTSFSAPHVAGAAALLRQVNPNATSDQILYALMRTARDLGTAGEDNAYGRGLINILAAIDSLPPLTSPHIFLSGYEFLGDGNNTPDPGENLTFNPTLINDGDSAFSVQVALGSTSPLVTITDATASFGDMAKNDTLFSLDFTQFSVSSSAQAGDKLPFTLQVTDNSGYSVTYPLLFYATARPLQVKATHDKGNFLFTVSNFGQYGFGTGSFNQGIGADSGKGFKYPKSGGTNNLFEAAVLFGLPTTQVSDAARDYVGLLPDSDFAVAPGGELVFDTTSVNRKSAQDGFAIFTDEKAETPIGLRIVQRSFVFSDTANDDYVILEYTLHNQGGADITGLRPAFFTDWDFPWGTGGSDRAAFIRNSNLGYMFQSPGSNYRGLVVTDTLGVKSFRAIENGALVNGIYDGFTDIEKWQFMSGGFVDTVNAVAQDGSMLIATGPFNIPAGDSVKTSFAIVAATSLANLQAYAQRAITKYRTELMCVAAPGDVNTSGDITLGDIIHLVNYYFDKDKPPCLGIDPGNCWAPEPFCRGDVNGSGTITLGDVIHLVNYYFDKDKPPCLGTDPGNCWPPVASSVCCKSL